ncbi:MAG: VanW family protein [Candidatus Sericytochromatia bacterium]|nr:VanW family protein [Candidatus Tanganyikabacteria bacterium]
MTHHLVPSASWWAIALAVGLGSWVLRPYPDTVGEAMTPITDRGPAERANLARGIAYLAGATIAPDRPWSLSTCLGSRTRGHGYMPAPSRLGDARVATLGGGLCQLASTLHLAALRAGLEPLARKGHRQPAASMPAGLDVALWDGGQDLVLANRGNRPIRIEARLSEHGLSISLRGWHDGRGHQWSLATRDDGQGLRTSGFRRTWLPDDTVAGTLRWSDVYDTR